MDQLFLGYSMQQIPTKILVIFMLLFTFMVLFLHSLLPTPNFLHLIVGVVLKMAQITKGSSARGQKSPSEVVKKPETMVIPSRMVVQIVAKVL